jgi:DNA-binding GntR family transcriptional regulator
MSSMASALGSDGRPETLVSFATRHIQANLADGTIAPGERISPASMAKQLGLSHIPVREALASLAANGYVVHDRGRGYFARILSADDLADINHWRDVLEVEGYRLAVPQLTDHDLQHMTELVRQMAGNLEPEDRAAYLKLHREFHFVCFRRAGSRRLVRMLNYLWDSVQPYTAASPIASRTSHDEHEKLLPLLATRDAEVVLAGLAKHRQIRTDQVAGWGRAAEADALADSQG